MKRGAPNGGAQVHRMYQNQSQRREGRQEGSLIYAAESSAHDLCVTFINVPFEQLVVRCLHSFLMVFPEVVGK